MNRMAKRTEAGNVTSSAREKYGDKEGKLPIFDEKSAVSAIKLRGHSDDPSGVLARAARWASTHGNSAVKGLIERVREDS